MRRLPARRGSSTATRLTDVTAIACPTPGGVFGVAAAPIPVVTSSGWINHPPQGRMVLVWRATN